MKDMPRVGFVCTGENALELSSAICVAGRLMRHFNENGYMTGGCYSCISPSKQVQVLRERICNMCSCNDLVITVGCDGFRKGDVIPDIVAEIGGGDLPYFSCRLSSEEYTDAETGKNYRCFPSRGVAAMYSGTLILVVSSDLSPSLGKLHSLMPALSFAIGNGRGRAPSKPTELENITADFYSGRSFRE